MQKRSGVIRVCLQYVQWYIQLILVSAIVYARAPLSFRASPAYGRIMEASWSKVCRLLRTALRQAKGGHSHNSLLAACKHRLSSGQVAWGCSQTAEVMAQM